MNENETLLADVMGEELRTATLQQGLAALRRRRRRRRAGRALLFTLAPLAGAAALLVASRRDAAPPSGNSAVAAHRTIEGTSIRVLTDEELLALFKDRPVALIGPSGDQRLVLFDELPR